jgi:autotransporter-associated beta strand protein
MRKRIPRRLAGAILRAATLTAVLSTAASVSANPPVPGYQLLWSSQFNGTSLNPLKWNFGQPWGSNVPPSSNSIGEPGNVTVSNNTLNLTAQNQSVDGYGYTTGLVNTSGLLNFTYGYVEADIEVPYTLGTWPAFWMLQNGWPPEIDVMEVPQQTYNYQPGSVGTAYYYYGTYHYTGANGQPASAGTGMHYTGVNEATSFNNYGMMWTPDSITFYFNGTPVDTITGSQADIAQARNMYLLLDLAIGGWPGNPPSFAGFPSTMQIQNVNVWQLPASADMTMNWIGAAPSAQWNDASSWQNGSIPVLGSQTAIFGQTNQPATDVNWSDFITVGSLIFQGGTTAYTLGEKGLSGLMLANDTGTASIEANAYLGRNDAITINSELDLYNNTDVINNMTAPIKINGHIYGLGALNIQNGVADIGGVVTNTGGINVDNGGSIDLTSGDIITPANDINLSTMPQSRAAMIVNAGTSVEADVLRVGGYNGGVATFNENAGRVDTQTWFVIGQSASAQGVANIDGGTLSVRDGGGADGDLEVGVFNSASGILNISGNARIQLLNGANLVLGSQGTSGNGTVNQSGGTVGFFTDSGSTAGGGALILGRNGSSGVYTYNLTGGTLDVPQIQSSSGTSNFNLDGGVLQAASASDSFIRGLKNFSIGTDGGAINTAGFTIEVGQAIDGPGKLTVNGGGTLILTNSNTYSGGTSVNAATLVLQNNSGSASGSGDISVEAAGNLSGTGTAGGTVVIASGGEITPGNGQSAGELSIRGSLIISDGAILNDVLSSSAGGMADGSLINIFGDGMGNLTVGSNVTLNIISGNKILPGVYRLINFTGSLQAPDGLLSSWTVSGAGLSGMSYQLTTSNDPGTVELIVGAAPTPEPDELFIFAASVGALACRLRRRCNAC